jgi:hypothetical protein
MKANLSAVRFRFPSLRDVPVKKSVMVKRGFSKPRRKVSGPDGSKSISKVFFPNSAAATEIACAKVVLPTPPAGLAIAMVFI